MMLSRHRASSGSLRILHADTDDLENPLRGGQPVRTFEVNSRLAARNHRITVFTSMYRRARRRQQRQGVQYRRLGLRLPGWGLSPHLSYLCCLGFWIQSTPHDLVVEEFTPPVGFNGLGLWTSAPVVLNVQWYFFEQWEQRYRLPFSRWMRSIASRGSYRHVIVQSQAMAREFQALLPKARVELIPCGIGDSAFLEEMPAEAAGDYVLFIGRLDIAHKGLDLLLEVWARHLAALRVPLKVVGAGQDALELERRIRALGLGELITLTGRMEGEQKAALLRGARLVVIPSRYETFGLVAAEAMAAGKPTVAFDIPHMNEVARKPWAELVPCFDTDAFGIAVRDLWKAPQRCREMGALAREAARPLHWDRIALRQENFYREVILSHHENA